MKVCSSKLETHSKINAPKSEFHATNKRVRENQQKIKRWRPKERENASFENLCSSNDVHLLHYQYLLRLVFQATNSNWISIRFFLFRRFCYFNISNHLLACVQTLLPHKANKCIGFLRAFRDRNSIQYYLILLSRYLNHPR